MLPHYVVKWENTKITFFLKCRISALPEFNQLLDLFNMFDSQLILTLLYHSLNLVINAFSSGLLGSMVQDKWSRGHCRSWTVLHAQCTSALSSGFPISQGNTEVLDRWDGKTKHHLISNFLSSTSAKNCHNWILYVKIIASQRWNVFWDTVYICRMTWVSFRWLFICVPKWHRVSRCFSVTNERFVYTLYLECDVYSLKRITFGSVHMPHHCLLLWKPQVIEVLQQQ